MCLRELLARCLQIERDHVEFGAHRFEVRRRERNLCARLVVSGACRGRGSLGRGRRLLRFGGGGAATLEFALRQRGGGVGGVGIARGALLCLERVGFELGSKVQEE